MSKQAIESTLSKVNCLIGVDESYKAPQKIMEIISDKDKAMEVFSRFMDEFDCDFSYDWFNNYFEDEHADRKNKKQDFSPTSLSRLMSEMNGSEPQYGVIYEPAAGTGSTIISHWYKETRKHRFPWDYNPDNYLYLCEELSDRAIPFLLFNLLIRGINALVIHGNALTREAKDVYHCDNKLCSYTCFSELRKLPHTKEVENLCNIKFIEGGGSRMTREEILQTAKPILFNTDMVRAILDDRKTATRRIAKYITQFDDECLYFNIFRKGEWTGQISREQVIEEYAPCKVGDILYVRETWGVQAAKRYDALARIMYRAGGKMTTIYFSNGGTDSINRDDHDAFVNKWRLDRWYPSIHMPKEAARVFLRVTDVRVERLQAMTLEDFLSEGVVLRPEAFNDPENAYQQAKKIFIGIWDSTTNELKYKWDADPWVWVIEFERIYPDIIC